jgi:hypothetical protein
MRTAIGIMLLVLAAIFLVRTMVLFRQIMVEANDALASNSKIPEFGPSWLRGKALRVHEQAFPGSLLRRKLHTSWWVEVAAFVSALACFIRFR